MPLITLGELNQLRLKIPSKGDLNWSDDFKTQFAQKIVEHDHTGADGKGTQLTGDSLADGSINRASLLAIDLQDLPNVVDTYSDPNDPSTIQYSSGQVLKYNASTNMWAPGTEGSNVIPVSQTAQVGAFGPGTVVNISSIDNINNSIVDMTSQTSFSSIFVMVNLSNPTIQKVILPKMINCIIISNVDIDFSDKVINSKVIIRREGGFCTAKLLSGASFEGCNVECDRLTSETHDNIDKTYFLQSVAKIDTLQSNLTNNNSNKIVIDQSQVTIDTLSNTASLTTSAEYLKLQNKAQVTVKQFDATFPVDATRVNLSDAYCLLLSVAGVNNLRNWDGSRWHQLMSGESKGSLISVDSAGNPANVSVGNNNTILVADSTANAGIEWQSLSGVAANTLDIEDLRNVSSTLGTTSTGYPLTWAYSEDSQGNPVLGNVSASTSFYASRMSSRYAEENGYDNYIYLSSVDMSVKSRNFEVTCDWTSSTQEPTVILQVKKSYGSASNVTGLDLRGDSVYGVGGAYNQFSSTATDKPTVFLGDTDCNILTFTKEAKFGGSIAGTDLSTKVNIYGTIDMTKQPTASYGTIITFAGGGSIRRYGTSNNVQLYGYQVNPSDYRLKEDISSIKDASSLLMKLKPCEFTWKEDGRKDKGFIAHEVQEILPEVVSGEKDAVSEDGSMDPQGVDYGRITPLLTAALQEALVKIDSLEARIKELEDKE